MFATCCGAKIRYEVFGTGTRQIVLLHGWGGNVDSFAPILRDLKGEYRLLVPEFPGHGLSGEPPTPWSVTEYMEATAQLIRDTGFSGADILAHSFGCRVAILLAATYPSLVHRMLLTGAAGIPAKKSARLSGKQRLYKVLKALSTLPVLPDACRKRAGEALIQRFGSPDYRALTPSMRTTFNRILAQDLTPVLSRVQAPVFLFWGEKDTATPLWMARTMQEQIPDCALQIAPGCGHFAYLEAYPQFCAIALALFVH